MRCGFLSLDRSTEIPVTGSLCLLFVFRVFNSADKVCKLGFRLASPTFAIIDEILLALDPGKNVTKQKQSAYLL